jgi:hypothetical protein
MPRSHRLRPDQIRRFRFVDEVDVFLPPMFQRTLDRSDFRVAEGTDRAACDVFA